MFDKISIGNNRKVYSFGKNRVIKISRIHLFSLFKDLLKERKDKTVEQIIHQNTGVMENINEYRNSKLTPYIADVCFTLFGLFNIQKRYDSSVKKYYYNGGLVDENVIIENIHDVYPRLKYIYQIIKGKKEGDLSKDDKYLFYVEGDMLHSLIKAVDYGIDEKGHLILLDGGNKLIGKILQKKGLNFLELFIKEGTMEEYLKKKYPKKYLKK